MSINGKEEGLFCKQETAPPLCLSAANWLIFSLHPPYPLFHKGQDGFPHQLGA